MIQSVNHISLYRKVDNEMVVNAGIESTSPSFYYNSPQGLKEIVLKDDFTNILTINEYDDEWAPNEYDLVMKQNFIISMPAVLFGQDGVTMLSNKIGLAVHIHSKTSSIQKTFNVGTIVNTHKQIVIPFEHTFHKDSLRGNVEMDFFLYLKEYKDVKPYHADKIGMTLSEEDLYNLLIIADGEGSAFPITEFSDKKGPLWLLEKNWADAVEDVFDSSNINLRLNIAHPLFEQVKGGKTKASKALMGDIMIQAMSMIIQQALIIEKNTLDSVDEVNSNSILAIVKYWVNTFDIDTTSLFTVMNSLRGRFDQEMLGGE